MKKRTDNIILIGMPAAGKSSVGVVLAKRYGYHFLDSDLLIQQQEGKLLREILSRQGQEAFLEIENQVNRDIQAEGAVIAPGGSVVYCKEAMEHFKKIGTVVYLKLSFYHVKQRLSNLERRGVVLKEGQTLKQLYDERVKLFQTYADITVREDGVRIQDMADKVMNRYEEYLRKKG